jgi:hypothetical protein
LQTHDDGNRNHRASFAGFCENTHTKKKVLLQLCRPNRLICLQQNHLKRTGMVAMTGTGQE